MCKILFFQEIEKLSSDDLHVEKIFPRIKKHDWHLFSLF